MCARQCPRHKPDVHTHITRICVPCITEENWFLSIEHFLWLNVHRLFIQRPNKYNRVRWCSIVVVFFCFQLRILVVETWILQYTVYDRRLTLSAHDDQSPCLVQRNLLVLFFLLPRNYHIENNVQQSLLLAFFFFRPDLEIVNIKSRLFREGPTIHQVLWKPKKKNRCQCA